MSIVYLNGEYLPLEEARVPVMDRGFIFGDGVYEVIPVYGGRPFRLDQHLERLDQSLAGIRLRNPLEREAWRARIVEVTRRNGGGDLSVYLQVTRGVAPRDHAFPKDTAPTVFIAANPLKTPPAEMLEHGVAVVTLPDIRWKHCDIKAITLLPNVLLRQQALDAGAAEALLVRDGEVTEGTASNVFIVVNGALVTPPKGPCLLPGITRDLVLELAGAHGIPCQERALRADELAAADEIFLTSSIREILPVTRLDQRPAGGGRPGPMWRRLYALFQDYKHALRAGTKE